MSHQALHHLALLRGLQPDVKRGVKKGQLAESHQIFLQSNWNAAGHAAGQRGKQKRLHKQLAKPSSETVVIVTPAQRNAPPFSRTSSKTVSSERIASHGRKRMVPQSASAKSDAIDLRIGCVSLASGNVSAMWI